MHKQDLKHDCRLLAGMDVLKWLPIGINAAVLGKDTSGGGAPEVCSNTAVSKDLPGAGAWGGCTSFPEAMISLTRDSTPRHVPNNRRR